MINQSPLNVQFIAMRRKQEDAINSERRYGHVELLTLEWYQINAAWNLIKYSFTQTVNIPELIRSMSENGVAEPAERGDTTAPLFSLLFAGCI
jgi:hypothetical protein